jgi:hypothetical protein
LGKSKVGSASELLNVDVLNYIRGQANNIYELMQAIEAAQFE